jgi:Pectate lyase superfamily protein
MAVLQISRVQQRRGLQQDLPQLASAEFGWSIDQRRLFIGNGTLAEGAPIEGVTEILTQNTDFIDVIKFYNYKGSVAGYNAQTGVTTDAPVMRTAQDKFDEFVSVRDFGARGDGVTNDLDAINRAITQIYRSSVTEGNPTARRAIFFPAGTYNIQNGVLVFPTWLTVYGDGISNSIIVQTDPDQDCVVKFSDSAFATGNQLGAPFVTMPTDISIEKLTLRQNNDRDVVIVDSTTNLNFRLTEISGAVNANNWAAAVPNDYAGIKFAATKNASANVTFEMCKFRNLNYAALADVAATDIRFNNCLFEMIYTGLRLGQYSFDAASAPFNFRVTNSVFRNVANLGIDTYANVIGIVSSGNSYYAVDNSSLTAIYFRGDGNHSLNDYFDRPDPTNVISASSNSIRLQSNVGLTLGTTTIGSGNSVDLSITQGSYISTGITLPNSGVINYQLQNDSDSSVTSGTLTFSGNQFNDNFSQTPSIDVIFIVQNNMLMYQNKSNSSVTARYNINYF